MINLNPIYSNYFVRINEYPGYRELIVELSEQSRFPLFLAIKHEGSTKENPHFHLVLSTLQVPKTFRTFMKTKFAQDKGNGHMSIKPWDGDDRAIQYLYHEEDCEVLVAKGFFNEYLAEQALKAKLFVNDKKSYTSGLHDLVMDHICMKIHIKDLVLEHNWDQRAIVNVIWDVCKKNKRSYPNRFLLQGVVWKIEACLADKGQPNLPSWQDTKDHWYQEMFQLH